MNRQRYRAVDDDKTEGDDLVRVAGETANGG